MKHIILTTILVALLLPTAAMSAVMSSPGYRINGAGIVSGGGSSTDAAGNSKSGIAIGQMVFLPPEGVSSPGYKIQPGSLAKVGASVTTPILPTGDINGDGKVDIADALLALQISVGSVQITSLNLVNGDVAPFINGKPSSDGAITVADALIILRKIVALVSW